MVPVEVLLNVTGRGAVPEVELAVKLATGAVAVAEIVLLVVLLPPELLTFSFTL